MKSNNLLCGIMLFLVSFTSCSKKSKIESLSNKINMEFVPSIEFNDSVVDLIDAYLKKYSHFNCFVLICAPQRYFDQYYAVSENEEYLLGPAYEGILRHTKSPMLSFDFKGKRIYVSCGLENLSIPSARRDSIFLSQQIKTGSDSIIDAQNMILKNGNKLYLHRAIFFSLSKDGDISINYRPDTLFLPKLVRSLKFDPDIK